MLVSPSKKGRRVPDCRTTPLLSARLLYLVHTTFTLLSAHELYLVLPLLRVCECCRQGSIQCFATYDSLHSICFAHNKGSMLPRYACCSVLRVLQRVTRVAACYACCSLLRVLQLVTRVATSTAALLTGSLAHCLILP